MAIFNVESTGGSTTGDDEESSDAGAINAAAAVASNSLIFETRKNTMHVSGLRKYKYNIL